MTVVRYLPSKQFSVIVVSLLLSAGLVYAADFVTASHPPASIAVSAEQQPGNDVAAADWQASLASVQAQSGISLPSPSDPNTVDSLLQAAHSSNVTDTVSKTLFVNLLNAKQQGLGDDIPTQDQLISNAASQINASASAKLYTLADLTTTDSSPTSLHTYGNAVMGMLSKNSNYEFAKTLLTVDDATTKNDPSGLASLKTYQETYVALVQALLATPVPTTLAPFHLAIINNYEKMVATYSGMESVLSDPIEGIAALQQYNAAGQDAYAMFINIAQAFDKNDILFTKDEPGAAWAALLQAQQQ
jgi:hypothetical protein